MYYPRWEEILAIHDRIVEQVGGAKGIRDINLLHSIAERPKMSMMEKEFYPDVFSKAATYLEGLTIYHVFTDGNKRSAIAVTHFFLRVNGYKLRLNTESAYKYILKIVTEKTPLDDITKWLKKHSKKI